MQCLFTFSLNLLSIFFLCFVRGCYCCIKFICVSTDCSLLGTLSPLCDRTPGCSLMRVCVMAYCVWSNYLKKIVCLLMASWHPDFLLMASNPSLQRSKAWRRVPTEGCQQGNNIVASPIISVSCMFVCFQLSLFNFYQFHKRLELRWLRTVIVILTWFFYQVIMILTWFLNFCVWSKNWSRIGC